MRGLLFHKAKRAGLLALLAAIVSGFEAPGKSRSLDTTYASRNGVAPADASAFADSGPSISICTLFSCGAGFDHVRTGALIANTTRDDGHSQENGLTILGQIRTGYKTAWARNTPYGNGANVSNAGNVYRATQPGISTFVGTGPSGTSYNASWTDGTVNWVWINAAAIDSKVGGVYAEVGAYPGSGSSWANAFNFQLQSGHLPQYDTNTEFDLYNGAANCPVGCNILGTAVLVTGPYQSTAGQYIYGEGTGQSGSLAYSLLWGLRTNGKYLASLAAIEEDSSSPVGIGIGVNSYGSYVHSKAAIVDGSTTPHSYIAGGAYEGAAFVVNPKSSSPVAYQALGSLSKSAFNDASAAPTSYLDSGSHETGIRLAGTYGSYLIDAPNFKVMPTGLIQETLMTPTSSSAACTAGQFTDDRNFHYVCVATNTWKRAALSAF